MADDWSSGSLQTGIGYTTLLEVLEKWHNEFHAAEGEICCNSFIPDNNIRLHYLGDIQYYPDDDDDFPILTVFEQTIWFDVVDVV